MIHNLKPKLMKNLPKFPLVHMVNLWIKIKLKLWVLMTICTPIILVLFNSQHMDRSLVDNLYLWLLKKEDKKMHLRSFHRWKLDANKSKTIGDPLKLGTHKKQLWVLKATKWIFQHCKKMRPISPKRILFQTNL